MMRPHFLLSGALFLAACGRAPAPMPEIFTESVGAWNRTSVTELPSAVPIERTLRASYAGPGKLDALVYQLTSPAVALDMAQRRKPAPDTVFFYSGRFFVLIQWHAADRNALHEFVRALEKKFPSRQ